MKKHFFILILGFLFNVAYGQDFYFKNHKIEKTFSGIKVHMLFQDYQRQIWLGTSEGLIQFDGLNFDLIPAPSKMGIISSLFLDSKQTLWIGTNAGSIYQFKNGLISEWIIEEGHPVVPITNFVEDQGSNIWFTTDGEGLYRYDGKRLLNFDEEDGLLSNESHSMLVDKEDNIWIATDEGINIVNYENNEKNISRLTIDDGLPDLLITCMEFDGQNTIWIGTHDGGICTYNLNKKKIDQISTIQSEGSIKDIVHVENGLVWFVREGIERSLSSYDKITDELSEIFEYNGDSKFIIDDIIYDGEGNIWIADKFKGVISTNCQFQYFSPGLSHIQTLLFDHNNDLWIGTQEGLFQFENKAGRYVASRQFMKGKNIISLYEDSYNDIWIGSFGSGLWVLDSNANIPKQIGQNKDLKNAGILSIAGHGTTMYAATLGGVSAIEYKDQQIGEIKSIEGIPNNYVYKVLVDNSGKVWFCTDGDGVYYLKDGQIINPTDKDDDLTIFSIVEDKNQHIWMSTADRGLIELRDEATVNYGIKAGLRDLSITSLMANQSLVLLIVHPKGIDVFTGDSIPSYYYEEEVGIINFDPNLNAVSLGDKDDFWIAGNNNLINFNPLTTGIHRTPSINMHTIKVGGKSIDPRSEAKFAHKRNSFTADYDGLWYTDYQNLHFRYKLEGHNDEWISTADRKVIYSNLSSGDYTFTLECGLNNNFDLKDTYTYHFTISKPIWKQTWFIVLSFILALLSGYYYLKFREKRIKKINELEKETVLSQLKSIKSQINPHFLFNNFNTLISTIEESPNMAVEYVETLSDYFRSILQYRDKEFIPLSEEIDIVENYAYLIKKRYGNNFQLKNEMGEKRSKDFHVIPMTLQLLVENAVKHNIISKDKPLVVRIHTNGSDSMVVSNNLQEKITKSASTQFGLQSIRKRYELATDQKILIEKTDDSFSVSIPLIKNPQS